MPVANQQNIKIGHAVVTVSGSLGGISYNGFNLGTISADGVTVTVTQNDIRIGTDQLAVGKIFDGGSTATISMNVLDTELFDAAYIPLAGAVSGTNQLSKFGRALGYDKTNNWSFRLTLTPGDTARRIMEFYKCIPVGDITQVFATTEAGAGRSVTFEAIHDSDRPDGDRLFSTRPQ